jgi:ribosomal protein S18 acetylase RimI-like enzyme
MDARLRLLCPTDEPFLRQLAWHAIHVPDGNPPPPLSIVDSPEISRYFKNWGQPTDIGFAAEVNGEFIGAAYVRLLTGENRGYGYVDDNTPELSIALLPEWRGRGVGTSLLKALLAETDREFTGTSLSVSRTNPAARLYERFGFVIVSSSADSVTTHRSPAFSPH